MHIYMIGVSGTQHSRPLSHAGYKWPSPTELRVFVTILQFLSRGSKSSVVSSYGLSSQLSFDRRHEMFRATTLLIFNGIQDGCIPWRNPPLAKRQTLPTFHKPLSRLQSNGTFQVIYHNQAYLFYFHIVVLVW